MKLVRTTLRCWPTEAFGSAIGRGGIGFTEAPASAGALGALSLFSAFSWLSPPPPLQPQPPEFPESQPQLLQPQLSPQPQPQPQPQPLWNMPQRRSQRLLTQHLWQQHELPQQFDSQPQLCWQPQLCSQPQLFWQPQLCSQQLL